MAVPSHRAGMRGRFTLMEMLVVVAIIVLLAAIAAAIAKKAHDSKTLADDVAKKDKAHLDCKLLAEQAKMYRLKYGDYPPTLAQLTQRGADGSLPFIEARHLIDPWGHEYQYDLGRNPVSDPDVWSMGPQMNDPNSIIGSWQ